MTSHELAKQLLAKPDQEIYVHHDDGEIDAVYPVIKLVDNVEVSDGGGLFCVLAIKASDDDCYLRAYGF